MKYTWTELYECADREVSQRERVYPRLVEQGRMTQSWADKQIAMMKEIAQILSNTANKREKLL